MDYINNIQLQEVCDIKQPVLFNYKIVNPEFYDNINYDNTENDDVSKYDVKVKDINDYWSSEESVDYVILPYKSASNLMKTDPSSKYFIENNEEFLEDSDLKNNFQKNDIDLKPNFTVQSKYDILSGSKDSHTPLRYHTNYRHFISVNTGKIQVKMTPWKSTKYLYQNKDFENYEFRSPIDVWKPQKKYMHEIDKLKFLEFTVNEGNVIFIPPYWWYSIKYTSEQDSLLTSFTYNSGMNILSNVDNLMKYYIQQSNIKKRITKKNIIIDEIIEQDDDNKKESE
jgi:hypothetical protein